MQRNRGKQQTGKVALLKINVLRKEVGTHSTQLLRTSASYDATSMKRQEDTDTQV